MAVTVRDPHREDGEAVEVPVRVVDCDVHPTVGIEELAEYVPEPWRSRYYRRYAVEAESSPSRTHPPAPHGASRIDAMPAGGGAPGSDPLLADKQLLRDLHVDFAILIPLHPRVRIADPSFDSAICTGVNEWLAATWLGEYNWHGRYKGSIRVCPYDPEAAVREIEKWAGHPHMVQVLIFPEASNGFGQPQFLPIMRVAAAHGLPVAMHPLKQVGMRALSPVGFPEYWMELFAQFPVSYMSHLASLVFNGTFEAVPDLRIVCVEGGFTWLAPFLWRIDKHWRALGAEVPHVKNPPSDYIQQHVRLTTQPLEEVRYHSEMRTLMQWMDADRLLMVSTDYPHYDQDTPEWVLPRLPREMRSRIASENAIDLYGLPRTRRKDELDGSSS